MGRGASTGHTVLDLVLQQWTLTIFVPVVLVVVTALVAVTRWWDRKDGMLAAERAPRERRWSLRRREERCTCSWHAVATEVRVEGG